MSLYHHTQIGYVAILLLIICLSILMVLPLSNVPPLFLPIVIAAAVIMLGLFSTLTIEVTEEHLKFWFGIGLIHKRVRISDIESCTPSRTFLPNWGIHLTHRGWLYNISGFTVVKIKLKNGKQFLLGTNEAEDLSIALSKLLSLTEKSTSRDARFS